MKTVITILFLFAILALKLPSGVYFATNYYVDSTGGNDANNGLSEATAWKSIAKVNSSTFSSGDSVLFKRGEVWRDVLNPPSSGSLGSHIIFSAYGTGNKPSIRANNITTGWTAQLTGGTDFIATNAPLSYWYFEDASSPSLDATANNNDFTWSGNAAQTSTFKQGSFALNPGSITGGGTVAFASLSANFPGKAATTDFTLGFWAKLKTSFGIFNNIVGFTNGSSQGFYVSTINTNRVRYRVYGSSTRTIESVNTMLDGGWHHYVIRWNGSTDDLTSLWVDGVKQGEFTITSLTLVTASALEIKRGDVDAVDELFIYPTALTDLSIKSIYHHGLNGQRDSVNHYYVSTSSNPTTVIHNGALQNNVSSRTAMEANCWFYDTANTRTYVFNDPTSQTVEIGTRINAINTNTKNYLTFDNLDMTGGKTSAGLFRINGSHHINLQNSDLHAAYTGINSSSAGDDCIIGPGNTIYNGYAFGIVLYPLTTSDGWFIKSNTIKDWGNLLAEQVIGTDNSCGIFAHIPAMVIEDNYIDSIAYNYYVLKQSIYLDNAAGTIVRRNTIKNSGMSGIKISTGSNNTEVYQNILIHNSYAINVVSSTGIEVYNNIMWGADNLSRAGFGGYGLYVDNGGTVTLFKNNIVGENYWTGVPMRQVFIIPSGGISNSDYNIFYAVTGSTGDMFEYPNLTGNTFAEWQALGFDANSLNTNPLFVSSTDFHLQAGSPAINSGTNVGLTTDKEGRPIVGAPDIGAFEYSAEKAIIPTSENSVAMNNGIRNHVRPDSLFDGNTTTRVCISTGSGNDIYFPNEMMYFLDSLYEGVWVKIFTGNGQPTFDVSFYSTYFADTLTVTLNNGAVQGWQVVDSATTKAWGHDVWAFSVHMDGCIDAREVEIKGTSIGVKADPWFVSSSTPINTPHARQNGMNLLGNEPYSLIRIAGALRLNGATWYYDTTYTDITLNTHQFVFSIFGDLTAGKLAVWKDSFHTVTLYTQAPSAANMPVPRPYDPLANMYNYYNAYSLYKNILPGSDSLLGSSWIAEHMLAGAVAIAFGSNTSADSTGYTIRKGGAGGTMAKGLNYVKYIEIGNEDARDWDGTIYYHSPPVRLAKIGGVFDTVALKDPNFKVVLGANPYWDTNDVKAIAVWNLIYYGFGNIKFHVYAFNNYATNQGGQGTQSPSLAWGVSPENFQLLSKNTALVAAVRKYLGPIEVWQTEGSYSKSDSSIYRAKSIGAKSKYRVIADWWGATHHLNRAAGVNGTYAYRLIDETNNITNSVGFLVNGAFTGYNEGSPDSSFAAWPLARMIEFNKIHYANTAGKPTVIRYNDSTGPWIMQEPTLTGDSIIFTFRNAAETPVDFIFDAGKTFNYIIRWDVDYGTPGDEINNGSGVGISSTPTVTANRYIHMTAVGGTLVTVIIKPAFVAGNHGKIKYGRGI